MSLRIPPPIVALLALISMWLAAQYLQIWQFEVPYQVGVAAILVALGIIIDLVSIAAFRRAKTTVTPLAPEKASQLVVTGLYRISRNPMYLGLLLILTGAMVWLGSGANVFILVSFVAYITAFQIKPEEDRLERIFGPQYQAYKRRVRRWL